MKYEYAERLWNTFVADRNPEECRAYAVRQAAGILEHLTGSSHSGVPAEAITGVHEWSSVFAPVFIGIIRQLTIDAAFDLLDIVPDEYESVITGMGSPKCRTMSARANFTPDADGMFHLELHTPGAYASVTAGYGDVRCAELGESILYIVHFREDGQIIVSDAWSDLASGGFKQISVQPKPYVLDVDGTEHPSVIVRAKNGAEVSVENI